MHVLSLVSCCFSEGAKKKRKEKGITDKCTKWGQRRGAVLMCAISDERIKLGHFHHKYPCHFTSDLILRIQL